MMRTTPSSSSRLETLSRGYYVRMIKTLLAIIGAITVLVVVLLVWIF
jgi:hypothetical protein